jgi:hypothetical protein
LRRLDVAGAVHDQQAGGEALENLAVELLDAMARTLMACSWALSFATASCSAIDRNAVSEPLSRRRRRAPLAADDSVAPRR